MAPTTKQPTSTREAILEQAVDLASTDGLEGLTIGRLATDTGLSKSGLFGHFGSKEELQLATVEAARRRFVSKVVEPAFTKPAGGERLRALCERYVSYLEGRVFPGGCFWAAVTAEFDDRPGPVRDAIRTALVDWLRALEGEAREAGVDDPAQLAFELHAIVQGANAAYRLIGDKDALRRARTAIEHRLP